MKTVENLTRWHSICEKTHVPANPLLATVHAELKTYAYDAVLVVTYTSSASWNALDPQIKGAMRLAGVVTGRTEDEVILMPMDAYVSDTRKREQFKEAFNRLASQQ